MVLLPNSGPTAAVAYSKRFNGVPNVLWCYRTPHPPPPVMNRVLVVVWISTKSTAAVHSLVNRTHSACAYGWKRIGNRNNFCTHTKWGKKKVWLDRGRDGTFSLDAFCMTRVIEKTASFHSGCVFYIFHVHISKIYFKGGIIVGEFQQWPWKRVLKIIIADKSKRGKKSKYCCRSQRYGRGCGRV